MSEPAPLRPGQRAWRIHVWVGPDHVPRFIVFRCIIVRLRPDHRVEVAPSMLTSIRLDLSDTDVFNDEGMAQAEASRRRAEVLAAR